MKYQLDGEATQVSEPCKFCDGDCTGVCEYENQCIEEAEFISLGVDYE